MEAVERIFLYNDWITFVFFINILLLILMKIYKEKSLLGFSVAFFTQGFIKKQAEKEVSPLSPFHLFLFLFSVNTISLSLYNFFILKKGVSLFLILCGSVTLYFIIQFFLYFIIQKILNIEKYTHYFLLTKIGYLYTVCLWSFPILIVYQYAFNNKFFLFITLFSLLSFRYFLILVNNKNIIIKQLFYFILYFCTLELAPLLILYKTTNI